MMGTNQNGKRFYQVKVKGLDVTSLKELGRLMGPLQRQAFCKVYGKILDLTAAEVFTKAVISLAQYYDQPLRCFTFGDFQMVSTVEEFEEILGCPLGGRKPYLFSGFLPSLSKIAAVVGDSAKELDRMKQTRNGVVGLPWKYLEGKARDMASQEKWGPFADILALLIFGVVLFLNVDGLVDLAAIDAFLAYHHSKESPVVAILADLFDTFDQRCEKNSTRIVCCLPALCVWLVSHLFQQDIRHPCPLQSYRSCVEKRRVDWDQHLAGIVGSTINWFPRWKEGKEGVLFSCGDYPNVPLIGTRGCINYNPTLAIRQLGAGWLSFQEEGPNVKTNPLASHGGASVNAVEEGGPSRAKRLGEVATSRRFIYQSLQAACMVSRGGDERDECLFHLGESHDMETCPAVGELLQRLIDWGQLEEMAPRKLASKRSRKDKAVEGTSSTPKYDSHHFRSAEHQQRFEAIKGWSFLRERRVQLRDDEYTDFQEEIVRRRWASLVTPMAKFDLDVVLEFYANAWPTEEGVRDMRSWVRGQWIPFDADALSQFLGYPLVLEEGQECEYGQRRNQADGYDEEVIAQLLCIPRQDFSWTAAGRWVRIMRTNMTTLTQIWMTFLLSNIQPSDHNSDLPLPKCQLVYAILTRMSIHVAQLIADVIYLFAGMAPTRHPLDPDKSNRALGFPALITGLCQSFGVPVAPSKVIRPPITRAFIEKYCTQRQAQGDAPQATDAPPPHQVGPAGSFDTKQYLRHLVRQQAANHRAHVQTHDCLYQLSLSLQSQGFTSFPCPTPDQFRAEVAWPEARAGEAPAEAPNEADEAREDEEMTDLLDFLGGSGAT
ncbi:hypothetical protein GmHk_03G007086 [Glycine max]|nr:hypothetical protein GmHk_03G007086 [Glycine max]